MGMININNLTKDYGNGKGVFNVSFEVKKGEVFGFLGPNGAGKTTTIRHLLGFIQTYPNVCCIDTKDCTRYAAQIQKNLGYIPGEINMFDDMTGTQFLNFMMEYRGMKNRGRMDELIERFELKPEGKIKKMSKGMKQKIGIITAFMHDPDILILDEPTSGLDPLMQKIFVEFIQEEKSKGKTILMSSHMFEEVEKTCDRVGIIKDGKMVSIENVNDLKKTQRKRYCITFKKEEDVFDFIQERKDCHQVNPYTVEVVVQNDIDTLIKMLAKYNIVSFDTMDQNLEDYFMQFYGGKNHD